MAYKKPEMKKAAKATKAAMPMKKMPMKAGKKGC
jgi:hypothetical protein